MKLKTLFALLFAPAFLLTSCATIMNGTTEEICIQSMPSNADVYVDNFSRGKTPAVVELDRGTSHVVRIELEGYETHEIFLQKKMSGWAFGNIVFGGVIGLAVDACSGGLYRLTPDQVNAQLKAQDTCYASAQTNKGYISVVNKADPSWEKIGQIQPK